MSGAPRRMRAGSGFTLIELIMVIAIAGILAATIAMFIRGPVEGYLAQSRRAALINAADMALQRIARDVRVALPNSIRPTSAGATAIEMLNTADGARYREGPGTSGANTYSQPQYRLQFNQADTDFNILGTFPNVAGPCCRANDHLVIYNVGQPGADAYDLTAGPPNVITPSGTTITINNSAPEAHINLSPGFQFAYRSPNQRIYLVDTPVSWVCAGGNLIRYTGYSINKNLVEPPPGASGELVTNGVTACSFTYQPGTATRGGTLAAFIELTSAGEKVQLLNQIHVVNAP